MVWLDLGLYRVVVLFWCVLVEGGCVFGGSLLRCEHDLALCMRLVIQEFHFLSLSGGTDKTRSLT
jgi:hypothetical protein